MKKKLLITVGAGASIDFGLPSVDEIDNLFDTCASKSHPLAKDPHSNLYRYCRNSIDHYYGYSSKPMLRKRANFEEMLYQLNLLAPYLSDPSRLHGSNALLSAKSLPTVMFSGRGKAVDQAMLKNLTSSLMDEMVFRFIEDCRTLAQSKLNEINDLRKFLLTLKEEFDIGIITLNYDNAFTQALPDLHTGFNDRGKFVPMSVLARKDWGFIYHLHGSIHFAMTSTAHDMHGISWKNKPIKDSSVCASGRNSQGSIEGVNYPISPFVAGYGKTQQILRQPFRTYFSQINRLVHEADSFLFLGYGFGDPHLNAIFSEVRDLPRPTVVVGFEEDTQDPLPFREDAWVHNLFKTLPGNAKDMSAVGHSAPARIGSLRANRELEVSSNKNYPLAVWYNGMLEACRNPMKILEHLC